MEGGLMKKNTVYRVLQRIVGVHAMEYFVGPLEIEKL